MTGSDKMSHMLICMSQAQYKLDIKALGAFQTHLKKPSPKSSSASRFAESSKLQNWLTPKILTDTH